MNPVVPGYIYDLAEKTSTDMQRLVFCERRPAANPVLLNAQAENLQKPAQMETYRDGTTLEEVLAACLQHVIHMNQLLPCSDNHFIAHHLELAMTLSNNRTQDRVKRGVEGTAQR